MTPYERILAALGDGVKQRGSSKATALCPAHDDRDPSLSISCAPDGKVLLNCHAGCSIESICSAMDIKVTDLFPPNEKASKEIETTYDYVDDSKVIRFQVVRYRPKGFSQRRPDGRGGWVGNLKGVRRVLYRLPELIAADETETVFIPEGEKDVDALRALGSTATCNPGGVKKWRQDYNQYLVGRSVAILPDNDARGLEHAQDVAERLSAVARTVRVVALEGLAEKGDVSDWIERLRASGEDTEEIRRRLLELVQQTPRWEPISPDGAVGEEDSDDPRTITIDVTDKDLQLITERAMEALLSSNDPPQIFSRGTSPVRIIRNDDGASEIQDVDSARMRFQLARIARWVEISSGCRRSVFPPDAVVGNLLAVPNLDLPVLNRIVTTPLFAADGSIVSKPGYSPSGCVYFEPQDLDPSSVQVPENPTARDVSEAKQLIIGELLPDFPFEGPADRANIIGLLLLAFARELIPSPTPLHLIEKPTPGTGATLLVDCVAMIATGRSATVLTEGGDEGEWRKRVTSALRTGPSFLFIDNLSRKLESGSLSAAITSTFWNDRILGKSVILNLPVRCVWVATGNNPRTSTELARRCVPIRMDAKTDRPWQRDVSMFRHRDLRRWVREHREKLIRAALLLVQHWVASGRPREESVTLGGFEQWAAVIGGILRTAQIPGFLDNLALFYGRADQELEDWEQFLEAWWQAHENGEVGVAGLYELIVKHDLPLDLGKSGERSQKTRLGILIKRYEGTRCGKFVVSPSRVCQGVKRWRLDRADNGPRGPCGPRGPVSSGSQSAEEAIRRTTESDDATSNGCGTTGRTGPQATTSGPANQSEAQSEDGGYQDTGESITAAREPEVRGPRGPQGPRGSPQGDPDADDRVEGEL